MDRYKKTFRTGNYLATRVGCWCLVVVNTSQTLAEIHATERQQRDRRPSLFLEFSNWNWIESQQIGQSSSFSKWNGRKHTKKNKQTNKNSWNVKIFSNSLLPPSLVGEILINIIGDSVPRRSTSCYPAYASQCAAQMQPSPEYTGIREERERERERRHGWKRGSPWRLRGGGQHLVHCTNILSCSSLEYMFKGTV